MNRKGFTLTEILIVMVVAGILLALILPNTIRAIERANVTALRSDLNSIQVAVFSCFTETRDWTQCDTFAELTGGTGDFLDDQPDHPFGGAYTLNADATGAVHACTDRALAAYPQDVLDDEAADRLMDVSCP